MPFSNLWIHLFEVHFDISRWIVNKLVAICHNLFESGSFFNSICKKYLENERHYMIRLV